LAVSATSSGTPAPSRRIAPSSHTCAGRGLFGQKIFGVTQGF